MKEINEMTHDELNELELNIQKRREVLFGVEKGDYFIDKECSDCIILYKVNSCRKHTCSVDQVALYPDQDIYNSLEIYTIEMEYCEFEDLTKINKELYEKVYNLVSKYEDELEKFKNEYLDKIKKLCYD